MGAEYFMYKLLLICRVSRIRRASIFFTNHSQRFVNLIKVSTDTSDGLNTLFEVKKGLPNKSIRKLIGIRNGEVGLLNLLKTKLIGRYMVAWFAVILRYSF